MTAQPLCPKQDVAGVWHCGMATKHDGSHMSETMRDELIGLVWQALHWARLNGRLALSAFEDPHAFCPHRGGCYLPKGCL